MGEFLYLVLRKIRLNIRRLSLFTLLLIVFYLFFFKYHHHHPRELRILEYTEGESRKASQLRTLKELYAHNIFSNTQTAASQAIDVRGPQSSNNNGGCTSYNQNDTLLSIKQCSLWLSSFVHTRSHVCSVQV